MDQVATNSIARNKEYQYWKYIVLLLITANCFISQGCSNKNKETSLNYKPSIIMEPSNVEPTTVVEPTKVMKPTVTPTLSVQEKPNYIEWKDLGLELLIRDLINKPTGKISVEDIMLIEDLCIVNNELIKGEFNEKKWTDQYKTSMNEGTTKIKDWSDLSNFKNLKRLVLIKNDISSIDFLRGLTKIEFLNVMSNEIYDYNPLSSLSSLRQLYLGYVDDYGGLAFLRDFSIEKSDINWNQIYYPYEFAKDDCIEGISPGNLVNIGFVAFDGKNFYTMRTGWGDLPHGYLIQYNMETKEINYCSPIDYSNVYVNSLNYYKNRIYYMITSGFNLSSYFSEPKQDGFCEYGIISYDIISGESEFVTKEAFRYLCVARDQIYGVNHKNEFVQMSLDGKERKLVVKEPCSYAYVNEKVMYYLTTGDKKMLMRIKADNEIPELILEGDIINPIFLNEYVYYMDKSSYLYRYDMTKKEALRIFKDPISGFNLDQNFIYAIGENKEVLRINLDGSHPYLLYDYSGQVGNSIQVFGDYLFIGEQEFLWKIKIDGTEYNNLYN